MKRWMVSSLDKEHASKIAEETGLPFFLAMMLEIRGIRELDQIMDLLGERESFPDPFSMVDMEKAVQRIERAIESFEKIAVYGDYDADGVTATSILYSYLESCGANVMFYIPERDGEGYGLNCEAIDQLEEQQVGLIITVDNGIASVHEVEYAKSRLIDVVITDHHRVQETLPNAVAVVDPFRQDDDSGFEMLSGVGVAFQLICALEGENCDVDGLLDNYADLIAIGTIADVVPLVGVNRSFVKRGLRSISQTDRIGLKLLMEHASVEGKSLSAGNVAFTIVPRINATGRMGSSNRAVRLLISDDMEEADRLSQEMCDDNEFRRQTENEIFQSAVAYLQQNPQRRFDRILVVAGENWHHGVIGIVASRLMERFGRPCLVVSYSGEQAKGSGRSIEGFSLFDAVNACASLLKKYGGHAMAAGVELETANIDAFRMALNQFAAKIEMPVPLLHLDCKLNPSALRIEMPQALDMMEPFGMGNPRPLFGLFDMRLEQITPVGQGKHLRLQFSRNRAGINCMKFQTTPEEFPYYPGDHLDLAVLLDHKVFRQQDTMTIMIQDIRPSGVDVEVQIKGNAIYEKYRRGENLLPQEVERMIPSRDQFASVYRFLRTQKMWNFGPEILQFRLKDTGIPLETVRVALDVLEEHGLIAISPEGSITVEPSSGKVDLFQSEILTAIRNLGKRD